MHCDHPRSFRSLMPDAPTVQILPTTPLNPDTTPASTYSRADTLMARLLFFKLVESESSSVPPTDGLGEVVAVTNNSRPSLSAKLKTLVDTVAPSRRFLPSRRDREIISVKSHSFPAGTMSPVVSSRRGVHSGASFIRVGTRLSRLLDTTMIPSSSNR